MLFCGLFVYLFGLLIIFYVVRCKGIILYDAHQVGVWGEPLWHYCCVLFPYFY